MNLVLAFVLGAVVWSFTEYAMHYWVGHLTRGRTEFSREHLQHHRKEGYFAPTPKKLCTAAVVLLPMGGVASALVGPALGLGFTVGFGLAYFGYEVFHRQIHVAPPRTAFGRWARRHHLHHHHMDPNRNHGVTTHLWDLVFRTWTPAPQVRIVRAKAPAWLLDDQGKIWAEYAADYHLAGTTPSRPRHSVP